MNRLVNEFLGTFFLVFTICVAAVYGNAGDFAPFAIGLVLTAMVYAGGHISKAHYNPAVSVAFFLRGCYISVGDMVRFILVQFLGAAIAVAIARVFFSEGTTVVPLPVEIGPALVAEILFTFMLVWVILNVATAKGTAGNQFYGIAIGSTVTGAIYTVGIVSLAVLNPAVALALSLVGKLAWSQLWIPLAGSLAGSIGAALAFNAGHPSESCSEDDDSSCSPL